jgi:flagellin
MLGINSNINSLVAQQNLSGSQSALSQAITRLSSGKRINSAADDAAGLAISTGMQSQINGLNQGVSNANDAVSMIQTASSGLSQITSSLQRIRQLAVQASSGTLSDSDRGALQTEVSQQIAEVNRVASQTTFNGKNVLDGSAGIVSFQVGANVGQALTIDLSSNVSASKLGGSSAASGTVLGTVSNLGSLGATNDGNKITAVNIVADGSGGYSFTDENNQAIGSDAAGFLTDVFDGISGTSADTNGNVVMDSAGAATALKFNSTGALSTIGAAQLAAGNAAVDTINADNTVPLVANVDISTANGANQAMEAIDNALKNVNTIQANLGAAQNRFTSIASTQQAQSTDLSSAQSQITDANFAQETANLSKAQVLQQAGISVLAQANSLPQQVLKLLG